MKRNLARDILWGVQWGSSLAGLVFIPALLSLVTSHAVESAGQIESFLITLVCYVTFGAIAGAAAGLCRPILSTKSGVAIFGALIGSAGLLAIVGGPELMAFRFDGATAEVTAVLGAAVGAFLGLWFRWRSKSWMVNRTRGAGSGRR